MPRRPKHCGVASTSLWWPALTHSLMLLMCTLFLHQAQYILLKGGNLTAGSEAAPYPGRAAITLHGAPDSRELPMCGAKVGILLCVASGW